MDNYYTKRSKIILATLILSFGFFAAAEEDDFETNAELERIEAELNRNSSAPRRTEVQDPQPVEEFKPLNLSVLAPFNEIAVIQKKYLPKSKRFQLFGGFAAMTNDPWFQNYGLNLKLGWNLTEAWGLELSTLAMSNSDTENIKDLKENRVRTDDIITTKGYTGLDIVWSPIYGKMSLGDKKIIPFDIYFSLGAGNTSADGGEAGSTFHIGTGQLFALSKNTGIRWDFSWNSFTAKPKNGQDSNFNNLMATVGFSWFFPGAGDR